VQPEQVANFVREVLPSIDDAPRERAIVVALDARNVPVAVFTLHEGTINSSMMSPAEILRAVLMVPAASFILLHNHPSGTPVPSQEDVQVTQRIADAALAVQIGFLDHIVLGAGGAFSSLRRLGHFEGGSFGGIAQLGAGKRPAPFKGK